MNSQNIASSDAASFDTSPFDVTLSFADTEIGENQRWSTWPAITPSERGPLPWPDWVVTSAAAADTELGILKTGKEADVFLLERAVPDGTWVVMAAKRYRDLDHRSFRRSDVYTASRTARRTRDRRALSRKSDYGHSVAAAQWAIAEWDALCRYWSAGLPVPYPVQIDGTEILMELISYDLV